MAGIFAFPPFRHGFNSQRDFEKHSVVLPRRFHYLSVEQSGCAGIAGARHLFLMVVDVAKESTLDHTQLGRRKGG